MGTSVTSIISHLHDPKEPVSNRMRAIFGLQGLCTEEAVRALEKSLETDVSALVRHEVAYVLGQMGKESALPTLVKVLEKKDEDIMVRHECAEAMGAIGCEKSLPHLDKYSNGDIAREIKETCIMAAEKIRSQAKSMNIGKQGATSYNSCDPAPAASDDIPVNKLKECLCDRNKEMFERYRAMFALRNRGGRDAILALCEGLESEKESALFRHEVAFVLGQMQNEDAISTLKKVLIKEDEVDMVRHEAAEALGAIGSKEAEEILKEFVKDKADVVRESVEVALDIADYNASSEMDYAETLKM